MAEIAPLRGIVYNEEKAGPIADLLAPPYDVVTPDERAMYHRMSPYNVMNIDLGAKSPEDNHPHDWHVRAAFEFNRWQREGILVRHEKPAIYYHETDFTDPSTGAQKTRHGFVCLLGLEEFGAEAKVRPHERTFTYHTEERLNHMKHVQANLSQVFAVFPDEKGQSLSILGAGRKGDPLFSCTDERGYGHRMWPVWDKGVISALGTLMKDKIIYIADGHHRYKTALLYRRYNAEKGIKIGPQSPLNYLIVYLCAITDPGLTILPAHRLLSQTLKLSREELERALKTYFDVQEFSFQQTDESSARQAFLRQLKRETGNGTALGLYTKLAQTYYLLKKRPDANGAKALSAWPAPLQKLDTVVLTSLLLQEVLGMSEEDLDDASRIAYSSQANLAIRNVNEGKADLAALHNPTQIEQVQAVAEEGLIMPRKSTYFFPKVVTGLVFNPLNPYEEIVPAV